MEKGLCLTADIGGTNTRVALFNNKLLLKSSCMTFSNNKYDSFETLIADYLRSTSVRSVKHAGIAVAGVVEANAAQMTNLAWSFSERSIASTTGAEYVGIVNDLQAQGYGLKSLDGSDLEPIMVGSQK